jgi:hypothetical protein
LLAATTSADVLTLSAAGEVEVLLTPTANSGADAVATLEAANVVDLSEFEEVNFEAVSGAYILTFDEITGVDEVSTVEAIIGVGVVSTTEATSLADVASMLNAFGGADVMPTLAAMRGAAKARTTIWTEAIISWTIVLEERMG